MLHGAKASRSSPRLFSIAINIASMAMMVALADMGGARPASEAAAFNVTDALAAAVKVAFALAEAETAARPEALTATFAAAEMAADTPALNPTLAPALAEPPREALRLPSTDPSPPAIIGFKAPANEVAAPGNIRLGPNAFCIVSKAASSFKAGPNASNFIKSSSDGMAAMLELICPMPATAAAIPTDVFRFAPKAALTDAWTAAAMETAAAT